MFPANKSINGSRMIWSRARCKGILRFLLKLSSGPSGQIIRWMMLISKMRASIGLFWALRDTLWRKVKKLRGWIGLKPERTIGQGSIPRSTSCRSLRALSTMRDCTPGPIVGRCTTQGHREGLELCTSRWWMPRSIMGTNGEFGDLCT